MNLSFPALFWGLTEHGGRRSFHHMNRVFVRSVLLVCLISILGSNLCLCVHPDADSGGHGHEELAHAHREFAHAEREDSGHESRSNANAEESHHEDPAHPENEDHQHEGHDCDCSGLILLGESAQVDFSKARQGSLVDLQLGAPVLRLDPLRFSLEGRVWERIRAQVFPLPPPGLRTCVMRC